MRILGIDPGSTLIGFGVIESSANSLSCVTYGTIHTPGKNRPTDLQEIAVQLTKVIQEYQPGAIAIERLFFTKNQTTAMAVSETRGVLLLTAANHNLPIHEFTPLQVKQMVSRYGKADKHQIQRAVQMLLRMGEIVKPDDAADALAIAICGSLVARS